jgi:hypothetical protein
VEKGRARWEVEGEKGRGGGEKGQGGGRSGQVGLPLRPPRLAAAVSRCRRLRAHALQLQVPALQRLHQLRDAGVRVRWPYRPRCRCSSPDGRAHLPVPLLVAQGGGPPQPERLSERGTGAASDRLVRRTPHCSSRSQHGGWVRWPESGVSVLLQLWLEGQA